MIRTTISLQDSVLKAVKRLAREEHRSLGDTITELLQIGLRQRERRSGPVPASLPDFSMGAPLVSLEDKERLNQLLDGGKG
jgi:hypothetical protein